MKQLHWKKKKKKNRQKKNNNNNKVFNNLGQLPYLTIVLLNLYMSCFANSVDPDQLASKEANWSVSALFAIKYANLYQQSGLSNLIGWKLEMGVTS